MSDEGRRVPKSTTRRAARRELRVWLDSVLYERILLEAAARGGSASGAVREALRQYFALKDDLIPVIRRGTANESSFTPEQPPPPPLSHPIVRMIEEHAMQERKLESILQGLSVLACMLDQAYQGLVGRLNPVPTELRAQRAAAAEESAQRWRTAVSKLLRRRYSLLEDLSRGGA